jgi:uncharacterized membrane protein HdeD (DUF308 family)
MNVKKAKWTFLVFSILNVVLGVCLVIWPQISALTLCYILGAAILILGIVRMIFYFRKNVFGIPLYSDLAIGLLDVVLGVILLIHPFDAVIFLPIAVGMLIVLDSMFKLQASIDVKRAGISKWWLILILAVLSAVLGVLLIANPFTGASALMILMGITLIADGIQNIWTCTYVSKYLKENFWTETFYIRR